MMTMLAIPARDELFMCRASLVSPEQSVWSIPIRSLYDSLTFGHAHAKHYLNVT